MSLTSYDYFSFPSLDGDVHPVNVYKQLDKSNAFIFADNWRAIPPPGLWNVFDPVNSFDVYPNYKQVTETDTSILKHRDMQKHQIGRLQKQDHSQSKESQYIAALNDYWHSLEGKVSFEKAEPPVYANTDKTETVQSNVGDGDFLSNWIFKGLLLFAISIIVGIYVFL